MKKVLKFGCLGIVGLVVLVGILGVIAGGGSRSTGSTGQTRAVSASQNGTQANNQAGSQAESVTTSIPESTPIPKATVAPTPVPSVGQDVTVDEMRWKMITAEDLGKTLKSNNQFVKDKSTPGRFIKVQFEMENLSKDMLSYTGLDLWDDQGRSFKQSSDAIYFIPEDEQCVFENLNPNVAKTCTVIYEVPTNAKGLKAEVTGLKLFGGEKTEIVLGL